MSTSSEGTKPFLTESKYRDSDVSEEWEAISHKSLPKAPLLLWLIASTFLLLLTNATTYLLVNQTRGNLDASCALYTLKWCRSILSFV
jgi:hypothetical protein